MTELVGWLAATLTLVTFSMRRMAALRLAAISANLCFIAYGLLAELPPVLALHLLLLPCNLRRLAELQRKVPVNARVSAECQQEASPCHSRRAASKSPGARNRALLRAVIFGAAAATALFPIEAAGGDADGGRLTKPDGEVRVFLQAVRCTADLLECHDVDIAVPDFPAMDGCRNFMQGFWAHATLVGSGNGHRFLLRCRYQSAPGHFGPTAEAMGRP